MIIIAVKINVNFDGFLMQGLLTLIFPQYYYYYYGVKIEAHAYP